jgi:DNA polymerase-3 subunit alpha (Gram-positive type)
MVYLLSKNLPAKSAFQIMEGVRKGKGLKPDQEKLMIDHQVPSWYIDSCKKIKYMFPKAHAVAYVIMALRIGWFKVHRPIYYYAAYFSRRAVAFDVEVFVGGRNAIRNKLNEIMEKMSNKTVTNKEEDLYYELEIAYEMVLRGYSFKSIDINRSEARDFVITEDKKSLIMPFSTLDSLGLAAASSIVEARNQRPFTSIRDVENRTKINRTVMARLKHLDVFGNLPDEEKSGLF